MTDRPLAWGGDVNPATLALVIVLAAAAVGATLGWLLFLAFRPYWDALHGRNGDRR